MSRIAVPLEHRFWDKASLRANGCWEWTGSLSDSGYGYIMGQRVNGKQPVLRAHRVAWEFTNGPLADDALICHSCDNHKCVNPDHLFPGSHLDNTQDMISKGRHCPGPKLTPDKVRELRKLSAAGRPALALAEHFDLDVSSVHNVLRGHTWKNVV